MKKVIIFVLSFVPVYNVFAQKYNSVCDCNYIEVTGTASAKITPNLYYLLISIDENLKVTKQGASIESRMIDSLNSLGLDVENNLKVLNIASNIKSLSSKTSEIDVQKKYKLVCNDAVTVAMVYKILKSINITEIELIEMSHKNLIEYQNEVKINAIKAAKEKAEMLVDAIGQSIGEAFYIEELKIINTETNNNFRGGTAIYESNAFDYYKYSAEFDKIELQYNVLVRFKLQI